MSSILKQVRRAAPFRDRSGSVPPVWTCVPVDVTELWRRVVVGKEYGTADLDRCPFFAGWYEPVRDRDHIRVALLVQAAGPDYFAWCFAQLRGRPVVAPVGWPYTGPGVVASADTENYRIACDGLLDWAPITHVFLNARNIGVAPVESTAIRSAGVSGRYRGIDWHEIVVTRRPLPEGAPKIVDGGDVDHVLRREHLARGHFKDYSDGPGLFGKYRGRFWWSPHVRGCRDEGSVKKGYRLEA